MDCDDNFPILLFVFLFVGKVAVFLHHVFSLSLSLSLPLADPLNNCISTSLDRFRFVCLDVTAKRKSCFSVFCFTLRMASIRLCSSCFVFMRMCSTSL